MRGLGTLRCQSVVTPSPSVPSPSSSSFVPIHRRRRCLPASCSASVASEVIADAVRSSVRRRRLILLRHADSSWGDRSIRDHDRPISKSGRSDAVSVSRMLEEMGWIPELILSSDATRTKETLQIMQENAQKLLEAKVHYVPSFYSVAALDGQTADHLQKAICQYSRNEILSVMCMGHNKGWEEAASMFCGASIKLNTCNAALLESQGGSWEEAFVSAGFGGWKLHGIVKPNSSMT